MSEQLPLVLLAAAAGGVGAALRFVIDGAVTRRLAQRTRGQAYPYGILVVNLSGSLLIGLLLGAAGPLHPLVTVLGVGALGGYTTFSTASFDTVRLLQRGRLLAALANGLGQLVLAAAAATAGFALGSLL
ncbi:MAG: CrcB family protein [Actinobacteria bacterium]|nr:CrcB family protein [Actinomycetota bacterium]